MKYKNLFISLILLLSIAILVTSCPNRPFDSAKGCIASVLYMVSPSKSELYIFDISGSRVMNTLKTGRNPSGIAVSPYGNQIYVSNYTDGTISVYQSRDLNTYNLISTIGGGVGPTGLAVNMYQRELYAVYEGDSKVLVFDTNPEFQGREPYIKYTIPISAQDKKPTPKRIALNKNGDRLFVTDRDRVYTIIRSADGSFTNPTASMPFSSVNDYTMDLQGIIVDDNNTVYIANARRDEIIIFDPNSGKPVSQISLKDPTLGNRSIYPINMAISKATNRMYVTGRDANVVSVVDLASKRFIKNIFLATGSSMDAYGPVGITVGADGFGYEYVYVTNSSGRNISIIDVATDTVRNIGTHASVGDLPPLGEVIIPCPLQYMLQGNPTQIGIPTM